MSSSDESNDNQDGINRRKHVRTPLRSAVTLSHDGVGELSLHTGDISDGGAYIVSDGSELPEIGAIVEVQVQLPGGDAPMVKMKIVRIDKQGIGLEFIDP